MGIEPKTLIEGIRLFNPVLAEPILPRSALAGSPGYNGISSAVIFAPEELLPKQRREPCSPII
jgi:hypothetical protein